MAEPRSTAIPAFALVAVTLIAMLVTAAALRVCRPINLDDSNRSAGASRMLADVDTRLDINCATAAELSLLPGLGPQLARRIVDHRTTHGPFRSFHDLREVPGIGERIIERLQPHAMALPHDAAASHSVARASGDGGG